MRMIPAALAALFIAAPAFGQGQNCGPRNMVVERLATGYGESVRGMGVGGGNTVFELFANAETGSWTITLTDTQGMTCLIAAGTDWLHIDPAALGEPL